MERLKKILCVALAAAVCVLAPMQSLAEEAAATCEALAAQIAESQPFETLVAQEMPEIESYLFVDANDLTDAALWLDASAATVEMIAVLSAKDDEALARVREELDGFVADLTEVYRDYSPEELPKLENAVVATHDLQIVLVLCKDAQAARELLDGLW